MPDKRQTSKQRRASRNRAQREAIAARRQNAEAAATRTVATGSSGTTTASAPTARGAGARAGKRGRRPGDTAVMVALGFAIAAFVATILTNVQLDDRGEPVPAQFGGVVLEARSALSGDPIADNSENIVSAYGAGIVALILIPVIVVAVTFVLNRRLAERNRLFTISMLALAGVVVLTGGFGLYYMPALIALAVGSFQVRKVEMPNRMAQRAARTPAGKGKGVVDVDEVDGEGEAPAPARTGRSRRSTARPAAADAEVIDTDIVDAEVVEPEAVDDTDDAEAEADGQPAGGASRAPARRRTPRSSSNRLRRTRPGEPAATPVDATDDDAPAAAADVTPVEDAIVPEVVRAEPTPEPAPAPEPEADATPDYGPDHDDILAELEEELRRESEAEQDSDDDTPNRRRR